MNKWQKLFSWGYKRQEVEEKEASSFVPKETDDGAFIVAPSGGYSTAIDLDGTVRSDAELISRYREMSLHPTIQIAIDEITNHAICIDEEELIRVNLDSLSLSESIKKKIIDEFKEIINITNFNRVGYEIFRRWYVDGRVFYHIIINDKTPKDGIKEIRYIDPRKIKKIREVKAIKLEGTSPTDNAVVQQTVDEYYVYNDKGFVTKEYTNSTAAAGLKISKDSIVYISSGVTDTNGTTVLSYLHSAIKPLNQLSTLEDASVIYKLVRAPERRMWYIDVGNLPTMKAEEYVRQIMTKYKNKLTYDAGSGQVRDNRRYIQMLDDFWLPRREGGRGTQVDTLPGAPNWDFEDVKYFQQNLLKSLNVPIDRLESDSLFEIGNSSQTTRQELRFGKFIFKLRTKFSDFFLHILEKQLVLKGVFSIEEWENIKNKIKFDYSTDTYWTELKDAEILQNRMNVLTTMIGNQVIGEYYSKKWVKKNVLHQSDEDIINMEKEIHEEGSDIELMQQQGLLDQGQATESSGTEKPENQNEEGQVPKNSLADEKKTYQTLMAKPNKSMDEYAQLQHAAQKIAKTGTMADKKILKYGKYSENKGEK